jgi:hypothetical protein
MSQTRRIHEYKAVLWDAAEHGFVFSKHQVQRAIHRKPRRPVTAAPKPQGPISKLLTISRVCETDELKN